jgi:hypothetical protein
MIGTRLERTVFQNKRSLIETFEDMYKQQTNISLHLEITDINKHLLAMQKPFHNGFLSKYSLSEDHKDFISKQAFQL